MNAVELAIINDGSCTVSEATMRPQDTVPKMIEALKQLLRGRDDGREPVPSVPDEALEDEDHAWWQSDDCDDVVVDLCDWLNYYSPPGFHFGTHKGDGACLGFWPDREE